MSEENNVTQFPKEFEELDLNEQDLEGVDLNLESEEDIQKLLSAIASGDANFEQDPEAMEAFMIEQAKMQMEKRREMYETRGVAELEKFSQIADMFVKAGLDDLAGVFKYTPDNIVLLSNENAIVAVNIIQAMLVSSQGGMTDSIKSFIQELCQVFNNSNLVRVEDWEETVKTVMTSYRDNTRIFVSDTYVSLTETVLLKLWCFSEDTMNGIQEKYSIIMEASNEEVVGEKTEAMESCDCDECNRETCDCEKEQTVYHSCDEATEATGESECVEESHCDCEEEKVYAHCPATEAAGESECTEESPCEQVTH